MPRGEDRRGSTGGGRGASSSGRGERGATDGRPAGGRAGATSGHRSGSTGTGRPVATPGGRRDRHGRAGTSRERGPAPASTRVELTYLPGLRDVLAAEVAEVLPAARGVRDVPGRDDAVVLTLAGALADVARLRTAVAAWVLVHLDVPRPKSFASPEHLRRVVDAVYASLRVAGSSTFRFEAAGADSAVFARLAGLLHDATGLIHDPAAGDLVVRVRRGARPPAGAGRAAEDRDPGWDVLVRVGPRPLSARTWRVADFPGAANATIAAAVARLAGVRAEDRVLNLMAGSGTLLVERLLAGPAAAAVAVDLDVAAHDAARLNLEAAGLLTRRPRPALLTCDATDPVALQAAVTEPLGGTADVVLADPPWGTLHGSHADAPRLHAGLLRAAHAVSAPGARLVVLTHEVKVMERVVRDTADLWVPRSVTRVYAKGHHPRIHVLDRR
ncbi:putative RNA methylase [Cellulomonas flavigena DSM 20109]|uniref:Putative RNA methylase n=1 Tax=Cellulomonas flavigena (strain ATCC 482 / DSM 20109 / BCRC 11376 / JCM 18109 / NBRC 3775 / NCIMB 8073 / NRS 134) TaxID=446466 RepID=D5UGA7_CELFN|nr:RNA methyltransferase [Cellulomonas flavigena]ADG73090.1 putative RNA methylase [Cellulomonas flavigena DSM 20109]